MYFAAWDRSCNNSIAADAYNIMKRRKFVLRVKEIVKTNHRIRSSGYFYENICTVICQEYKYRNICTDKIYAIRSVQKGMIKKCL